ncbi:interleukin-34 [Scyliorhinus canicula]|uniref:interleukin-34 n=1 Tax=Scyliorhinus canicula TaxID=7830 RepID=UPI0018F52507|nr:interleukin-34 [Scyliorhinus canicula]XP_038663032.1 interleukin-34 [Scyliorhinus canicula]XP_038663033.1 interleukin-34 [Scyliorhinus canicula]
MTLKMLKHSTGAIYFSLLGVLATVDSLCVHLEELHSKLQYRQRVRYMKDYFPVNYAVKVHYEDIYRTINVTRMQNQNFTEMNLKLLWVYINSQVLETVLEVLPKRHPSRTYVEDISTLFSYLRMNVEEMVSDIEDDRVEEILSHVSDIDDESKRKSIRPKALFDNCYRVMKQLFQCDWDP